jgi:hypothetical protein
MYILKVPMQYLVEDATEDQKKVVELYESQCEKSMTSPYPSAIILPSEVFEGGSNMFSYDTFNLTEAIILKIPSDFLDVMSSGYKRFIYNRVKMNLSDLQNTKINPGYHNKRYGITLPSETDSNGNPLFYFKSYKSYCDNRG